jgi:hypothetical protein
LEVNGAVSGHSLTQPAGESEEVSAEADFEVEEKTAGNAQKTSGES